MTNPATDIEILTDSPEGAGLLTVVLGYGSGGDGENAKNIRFFEAPEARDQRDGIVHVGDTAQALYDPWGRPYHVVLDGDGDEQIADPFGGPPLQGRRVVTFSYGRNGRSDRGAGGGVGGTQKGHRVAVAHQGRSWKRRGCRQSVTGTR